jgi:hypothetical protein
MRALVVRPGKIVRVPRRTNSPPKALPNLSIRANDFSLSGNGTVVCLGGLRAFNGDAPTHLPDAPVFFIFCLQPVLGGCISLCVGSFDKFIDNFRSEGF